MSYESKILISHKTKDLLQKRLEPFMQPSKQMVKKGTDVLTVRSIYFDTPAMTDRLLLVFRYERACPAWFKPIITDIASVSGRVSKYRVCMETLPSIRTRSRMDNILRGRLLQTNRAY